MPSWLKDAVFYEIYPQSFRDTNADGIGDFNGIIEKLDYIADLGCNALWINPCFDSPFKDAGYDVRDYKKTAERYGSNEDLYRLFDEAHKKGIKVLLDLVPGHTSEEHEWFLKSKKNEKNEYSDRFIWTDFCFSGSRDYPYIGGESERSGTYLLSFFKCQPALNYGWLNPDESWKSAIDSEAAISTREAMKDVMRFWMDRGCDGFRVDMAGSLVKCDDEKKTGTSLFWQDIRAMMDREYPGCALVSEWSQPDIALKAGFHMDFLLNVHGGGYSRLIRDYQNNADHNILSDPFFTGAAGIDEKGQYEDHSFFRKDSGGDICLFLKEYLNFYEASKGQGYISMLTCNHDTVRPSYNLTDRELKVFYGMIFTFPGVPFLYYGDEIGMRYLNLPTKEGGYFRTGSRSPMQWNSGKNLGFSDAEAEALYLPVDPAGDAPNAEDSLKDPDSLLNMVKALLKLRHSDPDLQADTELEVLYAEPGKLPFVYRRGGRILAVNPGSEEVSVRLEAEDRELLFRVGEGCLKDGILKAGPQSFLVF